MFKSVCDKQTIVRCEYFPGVKAHHTLMVLKTYSGEEISPLGMLDVKRTTTIKFDTFCCQEWRASIVWAPVA